MLHILRPAISFHIPCIHFLLIVFLCLSTSLSICLWLSLSLCLSLSLPPLSVSVSLSLSLCLSVSLSVSLYFSFSSSFTLLCLSNNSLTDSLTELWLTHPSVQFPTIPSPINLFRFFVWRNLFDIVPREASKSFQSDRRSKTKHHVR